MHLTKLEHSGLILEQLAQKLIIDPGTFTTPVTESSGTVAVVVTHLHDDHWTPEQLARIATPNPGVTVYTAPDAAARIAEAAIPGLGEIVPVTAGDTATIGPFSLRFFGRTHAEIHATIPRPDNVGVIVNELLAYAGDSFDAPTTPDGAPFSPPLLAIPAAGPWMRLADSIDYLERVHPTRAFLVHDMHLSRAGKELATKLLRDAAGRLDVQLLSPAHYETIELSQH